MQDRTAVRKRLGLNPLDIMPKYCAGCGADMTSNSDHFLTCQFRRKNELNKRHDQIANCIANCIAGIVREVGGCAKLEPSHMDRESRKRVDLDVLLDSKRILIDVTVIHPTAPSHRHAAAMKPCQAAQKPKRRKTKKYPEIAHTNQ